LPASFVWEICQFWQKPHWKLQPIVAIEKEVEPEENDKEVSSQ